MSEKKSIDFINKIFLSFLYYNYKYVCRYILYYMFFFFSKWEKEEVN